MKYIALSDGSSLPSFGSVSYRKDSLDLTLTALKLLIDSGIRHFEISELFSNGHMIVDGLKQCNLHRSDIYITFKVWPKERYSLNLHLLTLNLNLKSCQYFPKSTSRGPELLQRCTQSILQSGLQYADLLILHAPIDIDNRVDQYKEIENLSHQGLAKAFGLCNYTIENTMAIIKYGTIPPVVLEVWYLWYLPYPISFHHP
jgi:diketogulonate reductase-like aldo/keto reductase